MGVDGAAPPGVVQRQAQVSTPAPRAMAGGARLAPGSLWKRAATRPSCSPHGGARREDVLYSVLTYRPATSPPKIDPDQLPEASHGLLLAFFLERLPVCPLPVVPPTLGAGWHFLIVLSPFSRTGMADAVGRRSP